MNNSTKPITRNYNSKGWRCRYHREYVSSCKSCRLSRAQEAQEKKITSNRRRKAAEKIARQSVILTAMMCLMFSSFSPAHAQEYALPGSTEGQVTADVVDPDSFLKDLNARVIGRGTFIKAGEGINQAFFSDKTCTSELNLAVNHLKMVDGQAEPLEYAIHYNVDDSSGENHIGSSRDGGYIYGVCEGIFNLAYN